MGKAIKERLKRDLEAKIKQHCSIPFDKYARCMLDEHQICPRIPLRNESEAALCQNHFTTMVQCSITNDVMGHEKIRDAEKSAIKWSSDREKTDAYLSGQIEYNKEMMKNKTPSLKNTMADEYTSRVECWGLYSKYNANGGGFDFLAASNIWKQCLWKWHQRSFANVCIYAKDGQLV